MLMPDHVPQIDGRDPSGAYCYGYIETLLDALVPRPDRARRRHRRRIGRAENQALRPLEKHESTTPRPIIV
jgi:hypothetical protein